MTTATTLDRAGIAALIVRSQQGETLDDQELAELDGWGTAHPEEGEQLSCSVMGRWTDLGERVGAWKIAWTSRAARDSGGPGYRPFGYILDSRILDSGASVPLDSIVKCALEPELCLTMGDRLSGPDVTPEEARAAVRSARASFEINTGHLPTTLPRAISIGNSMTNWGLVLGPEHDLDVPLDSITVTLTRDDEEIGSAPTSLEIVDDPFVSLARVAAVFHRNGLSLEPGQSIITGAILAREPVEKPGRYAAEFGPLGGVSLTLT
ncbi:MAG: hypothetical protein QM747_19740 [Nocardioides sp.]